MLTKKPLFLLAGLFFLITSAKAQNVRFRFTDGTTANYSISEIQNFTFPGSRFIIKRTNGTTVEFNLTNLVSYRYDATTPVSDLEVINSAEVRVYPNPFKGAVHIRYELLASEQVSVEILDMSGRVIKKWPTEKKKSGTYEVIWNAGESNTIQPGTYICRIQTSKGSFSKLILMEQ